MISDPHKPHVVVFVTAAGNKMMARCGSAYEADQMEKVIKGNFDGCTILDRELRDATWYAARDRRLEEAAA